MRRVFLTLSCVVTLVLTGCNLPLTIFATHTPTPTLTPVPTTTPTPTATPETHEPTPTSVPTQTQPPTTPATRRRTDWPVIGVAAGAAIAAGGVMGIVWARRRK